MSNEMKTAKAFIKRAEKEIGKLPVTVKAIATLKYAEALSKTNVGNIIMLHISNPKTGMLYKETLGCF